MKRVLGLDLGTNSIGWAVVELGDDPCILRAGSRIVPTDPAMMGDFERGKKLSSTPAGARTSFRGVRRLRERALLRRERLHRVLNILGFLPQHYSQDLIFREDQNPYKLYGHIAPEKEPKLAWRQDETGHFEFIFKESFEKMLDDFRLRHPEKFAVKKDTLLPYDWTIYYLRKRALTERISEQELAWLLLNFNQKRGYYQLRGEDQETEGKIEEYHQLKVVDVQATDQRKGDDIWYNVVLENGWIYRRSSKVFLDWVGRSKEFIVTTELDKDGSLKLTKDGEVKRSFRSPGEDDWALVKKRTENEILQSGKSVGEYIYDVLLTDPKQKINGALVRVVERKFYKKELEQIIETQAKFHPIFGDNKMLVKCVNELYVNNKEHNKMLCGKSLAHLLINDILFYQRPLKSKKSLIADCQYESHKYVEPLSTELRTKTLKCIAKSHPLFQEFRLWQFVANLAIYRKDIAGDVDVTADFITDPVEIFDWLNDRNEVKEKDFFARKEFGIKSADRDKYRWNYVADKPYPCNQTAALIKLRLEKSGLGGAEVDQLKLWHILYSVSDVKELERALARFARASKLDVEAFVGSFRKCKPFANEYGAYSEKAIKKLLALMRTGKYWKEEDIDTATRARINSIINGEFDSTIDPLIRERCAKLTSIEMFQALPLHLACYIVYGRHSEASDIAKWSQPEDIDIYLSTFRQHSLNNPIVEQIVMETLRTVRDIWRRSGKIDEIHIELGRDLKNPAAERKQISESNVERENANMRIKMLLREFENDARYGVVNARSLSPSQQDIFKIYEGDVLANCATLPDDIALTIKKFRESDVHKQPSKSEIMRYKLWLEQLYRSPYTGEIIPLGRLFTPEYEIEHVIPRSLFFDDSMSNKVICESKVNALKNNMLGMTFIERHHNEKVTLASGRTVNIFEPEEYKKFVADHYANNRGKMKRLLMTEIPDGFNNRQLNDTRYITKLVKGLLSNIVREEGEVEATSKNVIVCSGAVTTALKRDWGLNDVWNDIIAPRFERMNELTQTTNFGEWVNQEGKRFFKTNMPIALSKGFNKKRIDHRHHALDAITIACASRNHINYLNNVNSGESLRHDLKHMLCYKTKPDEKGNYQRRFYKPWDTFTEQTREVLKEIIVGFKQNLRVMNKTVNRTMHYDEYGKKTLKAQTTGDRLAVRKSMHKDTYYGLVNLRSTKQVRLSEAIANCERVVDKTLRRQLRKMLADGLDAKAIASKLKDSDLAKVAVYVFTNDKLSTRVGAVRKHLDATFDSKRILTSVTDPCTQKILLAHLETCDNRPDLAFSPDGIVRMNENIVVLNGGKPHQPIYKVRIYETIGTKFPVGTTGNKSKKFVEADSGTNLFFAVYKGADEKRNVATIPLNIVVERQKQELSSVPEANEAGDPLMFAISPGDLVYLPTAEQIGVNLHIEDIRKDRIYKFVDSSAVSANFVPYSVSSIIYTVPKDQVNRYCAEGVVIQNEYGVGSQQSKNQRANTGEMIKDICLPIKVNRLGEIEKIIQ